MSISNRVPGLILAILLGAAALVTAGKAPGAWACSCVFSTEKQSFERAHAVFIGTAIKAVDPNAGSTIWSSGDPIHYTFDVSDVQKGTVDDPETVTTARNGATCGASFTIGRRYQVFAGTGSDQSDGYWTSMCSGTRDLGRDPAYVPEPPTKQRHPTIKAKPAATPVSKPVAVEKSPLGSVDAPQPSILAAPPFMPAANRGKPAASTVAALLAFGVVGMFVRTLRKAS